MKLRNFNNFKLNEENISRETYENLNIEEIANKYGLNEIL